ncbi:MAG: selenocysteine-specific translation elongation factor [candidate division Zixibacteria bacterium RBG_16_53_22]|nr:MAG: selenocysteine-specific translation elongation factor [candidate division Zixibacteria bacterium RBG_16_53_22]
MFVIGTAGHIDHGKSSLVLKMTGIDPDRLPEEKERGMTIDLGFAWATLPSGRQVGIVDVPGHERFVKNMVAGVGGIDAVIFVIAADDGWMPQSEEHFQIIRLLDIKTGLVAMTKKDLVENDYLQLQIESIREHLTGSFLEGCPIVPTSTITGDGISDILKSLDSLLTDQMQRPDLGAARLFIDRKFTIQGMGTVVTGTLLEGKLALDQQVEIQPTGMKLRIRSLQTHKSKISEAVPGSRVAINLAGVDKSAIERGEAVCLPGTVAPTQQLAGELSLIAGTKLPVRNGSEVSFLLGTADLIGRVYLLDRDILKPGERAPVRFKLKSEVAAKIGDKFIIRRISPQETVGGGRVLDTEFSTVSKNKGLLVEILQKRTEPSPEIIVMTELEKGVRVPISRLFQNIPFEKAAMERSIKNLADKNRITIAGDSILSRRFLDKFAEPALQIIKDEHDLRQWSDGLEPGILAKKLKIDPARLPAVVDYLISSGKIAVDKGLLKIIGHQAQLNPDQMRLQGRLHARLSASPLSSPTRKELVDEDPKYEVVINFLRDKGEIVELKGGILFTTRDFEKTVESLVEFLKISRRATASDIKSHLKTSRKYVIPLLEKLDQMGVTRRDGDYRILGKT